VKLTVVGCAGSFPRADSACSAYLVEAEGFRLLLDMGNGALGALQRYIGLYDLDAILLTHLHADHCLDACSYVVARRYGPDPLPALPLYAPAGAMERLARAYEVDSAETDLGDVYDEQVLSPGVRDVGPFRVTADRTAHPVETYGVRVEHGGRSLAYSADTGPTDAVVALARDSDAFLCEATFASARRNPPHLHMSGADAGEHATRAGAGRLLLTHLTAWSDPAATAEEAAARYAGPISVVASGETYDV